MGEYYCGCCGRRLDRQEVGRFWDDGSDEIFLYCKYCGEECCRYEEESEEEEEEDELDGDD